MSYFKKNRNKYPEHEFSKFIDVNNSYSNEINYSDINEIDKNSMKRNTNPIMLEPRLQEYIDRKRKFKENNIEAKHLEKQFSITKRDIRLLRDYFKGNRINYNDHINNYSNKQNHRKKYFPSSRFKKDKRVPELKNIDKHELPINRGMFVPDHGTSIYDDMAITNEYMDYRDVNEMRNYRLNKLSGDNHSELDKVFSNDFIKPPERQYESDRNTMYNNKIMNRQFEKCWNNNFDNPIGQNYIDYNKIYNMPSNTKKSYGYRNISSHHFDFVDDRYVNGMNTIIPGLREGTNTRLANKKVFIER